MLHSNPQETLPIRVKEVCQSLRTEREISSITQQLFDALPLEAQDNATVRISIIEQSSPIIDKENIRYTSHPVFILNGKNVAETTTRSYNFRSSPDFEAISSRDGTYIVHSHIQEKVNSPELEGLRLQGFDGVVTLSQRIDEQFVIMIEGQFRSKLTEEARSRFTHAIAMNSARLFENAIFAVGPETGKNVPQRLEEILVSLLELKHLETRVHCNIVGELARAIGSIIGLSEEELAEIRTAGNLHDIGKIGISADILLKPAPLTQEEIAEMQKHAKYTEDILIQTRAFFDIARDASCHQEKWDGSGYPYGLTGENIPFSAQIIAIADVVASLAEDRVYRNAIPFPQIISHLHKKTGIDFHPNLVEVAIFILENHPDIQELLSYKANFGQKKDLSKELIDRFRKGTEELLVTIE